MSTSVEILIKTFMSMPEGFTSFAFRKAAEKHKYQYADLPNHKEAYRFLRIVCENSYKGSKTWSKRKELINASFEEIANATEKDMPQLDLFDQTTTYHSNEEFTESEKLVIAKLKQKGYSIEKTITHTIKL